MAELPELGEHCSMSECGQLDFLPVVCRSCSRPFCKLHYFTDSHGCDQNGLEDQIKKILEGDPVVYPCSLSDCKRRELIEIKCDKCEAHFCLRHRHAGEHSCQSVAEQSSRSESMTATKEVVAKITANAAASNKPKKKRNPKNQKMAAKVQLMKLKMSSVGDSGLPQEERVYLKVFLPMRNGGKEVKSIGAFVSKLWSLGRVVDAVSELAKVENKNNVGGAEKLVLFRHADGKNLCRCISGSEGASVALSRLLDSEELFTGDAVVLEYVDDLETEYLDVSSYK